MRKPLVGLLRPYCRSFTRREGGGLTPDQTSPGCPVPYSFAREFITD
jgi:hypothetical protein